MSKTTRNLAGFVFVACLIFTGPQAFAKKDGFPAGWGQGEKKGWEGGQMPPGLSKREAEKAKRVAKKAKRESEKEAKKAQREQDKAAKEAKRKARHAEKEAEKEARAAAKKAEEAAALVP